ncbi:MAG: outer membrane protein transport protein, partial [Candidatus Krumholzibacteria bacterium]|nr:outer membrane protein transport protein [Candidatus Krumholzibacteria bacterium]
MQRVVRIIAIVAVSVPIPWSCFAAGFSIFEAGAKALGMGGAFTAQADDPSAIFFNAAGIADLDQTRIYFGVSTIFTGSQFVGVDPDPGYGTSGDMGTMVFTPINAFGTYQFKEGLTGGIGIFNAYGLGQEWENPTTFPGRHISTNVQLVTFFFNPTLAWRPYDWFSVGAGLQAVYTTVELHRTLQKWDPNGSGLLDIGTATLEGNTDLDWGGNVGVLVDVYEGVKLGLAYRSAVTGNLTGDATFEQQSTGSPQFDAAVAAQFPENQGITTEIKMPWLFSAGVAYSGLEKWVFEIDFNYTGWSEFDVLEFRFDDPDLASAREQGWDDVLSIRTGLSYSLTEVIDLRGGYYYDPTPQPTQTMSPILPDYDRHGITLGFGYDRETWVVDVFSLLLLTGERSTEGLSLDGFNGTY